MKKPNIKTDLPGPKARELLARDALVVSPSYPRDYPFVMSHGKGAEIWDVDGNRFLDFAAGIAVCSTGHSHPAVVQAIKDAADRFLHISSDYWHEGQVRLAERMNELSPMKEPVMSFFAQSGHRERRGRVETGALHHGTRPVHRVSGRISRQNHGFAVVHLQQVHPAEGLLPEHAGRHARAVSEQLPAAVGGCGSGPRGAALHRGRPVRAQRARRAKWRGFSSSPFRERAGTSCRRTDFLQGLRELCDRHGILLIFDEVQSGIGRTGKMFAAQHWDVAPDIMTLAKGLGSGLPIGMVVAKRSIMQKWTRGAHGNTFGGNPLCCAAALATIDLVEREYCANAAKVGDYFMRRLRAFADKFPVVGEVRGKGLMIGVELVKDRASKEPAKKLCDALITRAYHNGLILLSCGQSTVRFMPPLVIDEADVDEAIAAARPELDRGVGERALPLSRRAAAAAGWHPARPACPRNGATVAPFRGRSRIAAGAPRSRSTNGDCRYRMDRRHRGCAARMSAVRTAPKP